MKLIIGLGNVGEKYKLNRHNIGFMFLDYLAEIFNLQFLSLKKANAIVAKEDKFILAKPTTMMNSSGESAGKLLNFYSLKLDELFVVHDDLDIKLGEYKIQKSKGPELHNGINDIENKLGTKDFWRVRIGIDNRGVDNRIPGKSYALSNFDDSELMTLERVFDKVIKELSL